MRAFLRNILFFTTDLLSILIGNYKQTTYWL
jgi:hypothetical protein